MSYAMQKAQRNGVAEYSVGGEKIKLSPSIIRQYLITGNPENVTDQEIMMFLMLCRTQHLNPFARDAYLIKYGSQPATIVTGKGTFLRRASANPNYDGKESGVITVDPETGIITNREGCFYEPGEKIIGGWCKVYRKDRTRPECSTVPLEEYIGRKKDGSVNGQWATKPATMIRKVAEVQALREAFPEDFSGLYSPEEMPIAAEVVLDETPVSQPDEVAPPPAPVPAVSPEDALFG